MILDDYLRQLGLTQRLAEHEAWQEEQRQRAMQGPLQAIIPTAQVGASGLGLALEGLGTIGKAATGGLNAAIGQATEGSPLQNEYFQQALLARRAAGGAEASPLDFLGVPALTNAARELGAGRNPLDSAVRDFAAAQAANEGSAGVNKYASGLQNSLLDPSNLIPIGRAEQLGQAAIERTASRLGAGSELSDEFGRFLYDAPAGPRRPNADDKKLAREFAASLETPPASPEALGATELGGVAPNTTATPSVDAGAAYREYHSARKSWLDETREVRGTSMEGADEGRAKAWFEEIYSKQTGKQPGVDFPRTGTPFREWVRTNGDVAYNHLLDAEDEVYRSVQQAIETVDDVLPPANPAQSSLIPGSPDEGLGALNERYNAAELADTKMATPEELFASGLDNVPLRLAEQAPANTPQSIKATVEATLTKVQPLPAAEEAKAAILNEALTEAGNAGAATTEATGRLSELLRSAFQRAKVSQGEAFKREGAGVVGTVKALPGMWAGITTQTVRNLLQDEAFVRLLISHEGIGQGTYNKARAMVIKRVDEGERNEVRLLGNVSDFLEATGGAEFATEVADKKLGKTFFERLGGSAWELEADTALQLNALEQLAASTLIGLANPTRAVTNLALMPLGLATEARQTMFKIINNVTHQASRGEAFKSAYVPYLSNSAERLLVAAEREGLDTARLRGASFVDYDGTTLAAEGRFSPQNVQQVLGKRYADEWQRMVEAAREAGFAESRRVFGDFHNKGPVEKNIAKFLPFMSWSWRAYPRVSNMVLAHPAVTAGLYQLYKIDIQQAKEEGRKDYQYGTVVVNKDTPLVGLLASVFTPEQESEMRFNPLSFFSPIGSSQLAALVGAKKNSDGDDKNLYEQATDLVELAGGGFNPAIQTAAYVGGATYKSPNALSRYAPVDMALDNLGDGQLAGLNVPTLQGVFRGARQLATGEKDNFDPIEKKAYELVYERTGKPASDKSNNKLAAEIRNKTGVYLEAERVTDIGGARRALFNANSPVSIQTNTMTGEDIRKSKAAAPYSYQDVQQMKGLGLTYLASQMELAIANYERANPAARATEQPAYFRR